MIFFVNAQGDAMQVTPSSVYQGSNNASEIVLIAPFPQETQALAAFTLPNGVRTEPVVLTSLFGEVKDGLSMWRATLTRSVTEFSGTATVSFKIILAGAEPTTAAATFNIQKSYAAIGEAPLPANNYNAILAAITNLANQIADVSNRDTIKSIALDPVTYALTVTYYRGETEQTVSTSLLPLREGTVLDAQLVNSVLVLTLNGADGQTVTKEVNLGTLVGGIESVSFDDTTNTLILSYLTPTGTQTARINLNDLLDDLDLTFDTAAAELTQTAGGVTKTVNLGTLREGNVTGIDTNENGELVFSLLNADGTERVVTVDIGLGDIDAALDEIIDIQETLIGVPEYDGSITIVTN